MSGALLRTTYTASTYGNAGYMSLPGVPSGPSAPIIGLNIP